MPKSPRAYRDIAEAAAEVGVEPHVLRFWERELSFVRPLRRKGGRRFYRPSDIERLREVRQLREAGRSLADIRRSGLGSRPQAAKRHGSVSSSGWDAAYEALAAARRRLEALLAARPAA